MRPPKSPVPDLNRLTRLVGILGIAIGLLLLVGTATGTLNKGPQANGYFLGACVLAYGLFRLWGGRK